MHAGCLSVSIIHGTSTWTTGSLTCTQMLMQAFAHGGVRTHVRVCTKKESKGTRLSRNVKQGRRGSYFFRERKTPEMLSVDTGTSKVHTRIRKLVCLFSYSERDGYDHCAECLSCQLEAGGNPYALGHISIRNVQFASSGCSQLQLDKLV